MKKLIKKIFKNYTVWLILIVAVGFAVRLYRINAPLADWHSWRQADTASVSRYYVDHGINLLSPRYQDISSIQTGYFNPMGYRFVEFPIYNALHALLAKVNMPLNFEGKGRLISILSWAISTILVFLIGSKFFGKLGGIFSAFYFAFIPFNIYFTRVILPEPMTVMFGLLGLYLFMIFMDKEKDSFLYLSGLFFALGFLLKPFVFFYLFIPAYMVLNKYRWQVFKNPKLLIKFLIFTDIILIPFFAWRAVENHHLQGIPFFNWMFNGDGIRFRPAFWRWIFGERIGHLILGIWGLIPFAIGLVVKNKKTVYSMVMILGIFVYVSIFATVNVRHDYYQIITIPFIAMISGAGSAYLLKQDFFNGFMSKILLGLSIVMMLGLGWYQIKEDYPINHPEIIEAGQAIDKIAPKDALVIAPYNGDTAFLYQTKRWGWPAIDDSIENIIKKGASYYVSVTPNDTDTKTIQGKYKTIVTKPDYVIVDLHQPLKPSSLVTKKK